MSKAHYATAPSAPANYVPDESSGLTTREYMATHIMAGLVKPDTSLSFHELAADSVAMADALIQALNDPNQWPYGK